MALVVGGVVLVVDLVRSLGLASCWAGEALEDQCVAHECDLRCGGLSFVVFYFIQIELSLYCV